MNSVKWARESGNCTSVCLNTCHSFILLTFRSNPEHVYDVFCEIGIPKSADEHPFILTKFPESFTDNEVLRSIPQFSYPCRVITESVTHFSFVLTGGDSKWTYGYVRYTKSPAATCLVMLSSLPWHDTFYKTLNFIAELTNKESPVHLGKFLEALYTMPVPDPGLQLSVSYYINAKEYKFTNPCPDHHKIPCIPEDRNLTEYYNAVDSHTMILIFTSLLNERRILMTSKKLSRLSACIQAANSLIYPMYWQHIFIPVLPNHLLDYLSAPMPFLIGVPSETFSQVKRRELGDVVILDADENHLETPYDDLHMLPVETITFLKKNLASRPNNNLLGDTVPRTFLKALVMLIGGYRDALCFPAGQRITFNREAFINSRPPPMQPFLERMLQLQIFQQFIEGRLNMLHEGQGFNDEFEFELNLHEDKSGSTHRILRDRYNEWLSGIKKEGSAIIKSVNPAMKTAYRHVRATGRQIKDKSKQAYRDLRSILQQNPERPVPGGRPGRPRSAPSSPVASPTSSRKASFKSPVFRVASGLSPGVKKSISGVIVEKTERTATYVREKALPSAAQVNRSSCSKSTLPNSRSSDHLPSLLSTESKSRPIFEMGDLLGELDDIFPNNSVNRQVPSHRYERPAPQQVPVSSSSSSSSYLLLPPPPSTGHSKSPNSHLNQHGRSYAKSSSNTPPSQDLIQLESPENIWTEFDPLISVNSTKRWRQ